MAAGRPNTWTAAMPTVRGVISRRASSTSMQQVDGSTSAKTGSSPFQQSAFTVEQNVKLGTITSPGGHSSARHARVRPISQLETLCGAGWSRMAAARSSSNLVYFPKLESILVSNRSATSAENWSRSGK